MIIIILLQYNILETITILQVQYNDFIIFKSEEQRDTWNRVKNGSENLQLFYLRFFETKILYHKKAQS